MEKILTVSEAWEDFVASVFPGIEGREKRSEILRAISHDRAGMLGQKRIRRILEQYAPDRYRFEERVVVIY